MRTLQAASEDFALNFLVRLAPSVARISISRTGHHYLHMSNTSAYAGIFFSKKTGAQLKNELRAIFVPIHLHLSSTNAFPKAPADHIPFASVPKTNIHDIIFGFFPVRLHSVGVIP